MQTVCCDHANSRSRSKLKDNNLIIRFHVCIRSLPFKELHYVFFQLAKIDSSVRRCTEYMSPLYGLKVNVINLCQALKDIQLTLITYLPKFKKMKITHVHGRSSYQSWV